MDIAPPPPPGSRIQELGDRLIVSFRPRRSWGELAFLCFWLTAWTFAGGLVLYYLRDAGLGALFLLVWLCFWGVGEWHAISTIAWQLVGRERLVVSAQSLEVEREIRRFVRVKTYDTALVREVRAVRTPGEEESEHRDDFCLQLVYGDKKIRVGEEMGEREAEYVASVVLGRIHPRPRWSDDRHTGSSELSAEVLDRVERTSRAPASDRPFRHLTDV